MYDIIIIGAGPAGLTAALYARRAGKRVLLLEGNSYGGQITLSPRVENYPGFAAISGTEFSDALLSQVLALDTETDFKVVTGLARCEGGYRVLCDDDSELTAKSVIIAAGVHHRPLGVEREEELVGAGISYCAVCDGAFYAGAKVAVVGGGNTALGDALQLAQSSETVYLIHRRSEFRGESGLVEKLREKENVVFITPAVVTALHGEAELEAVTLKNPQTGETQQLSVAGLFVAVGQIPQNEAFADLVECDEAGYILADEAMATSAPGVFVAGDCRQKQVRQLTTAVSDGAIAALSACSYVDTL
ncbi:MAG: FAD-dependent oxidoreductase [Clostridia bacterium]|nr:FAD-dependent oxidoreductase [Clostridia bacterium]